jgi:hypothetical protein
MPEGVVMRRTSRAAVSARVKGFVKYSKAILPHCQVPVTLGSECRRLAAAR